MCSARRRKRTSNGNNRHKKGSPPGFLFCVCCHCAPARRFLSLRGGRSPTRQSVFFLRRLPVNRCRGGRLCPPETFPLRGRWQREALTDEVSLRASAHAGVPQGHLFRFAPLRGTPSPDKKEIPFGISFLRSQDFFLLTYTIPVRDSAALTAYTPTPASMVLGEPVLPSSFTAVAEL